MPTYDYRCPSGHRYEKREPFGSPAQQPCERCDKQAQRVLTSPTIVFKGSGWYKTDSRGSNSKIGTDRDSGDSESKTAAKAEEAESKKAETASKKAEKTGSKTSAKTASPTSKKTSGATPSKAKSSSSSASKNGGSGSSSTKSGSD
ncbi:MAG: hypothetical protein O2895_04425 [Chloroflexi bacterium]|nr:hypothetical protein [Chloroflexota bacterium]